MGDAFSKITSILLCVVMMFIIPVFYMREESERITQTVILDEVTDFVDGVRNTGIISREDYLRLEKVLYNLGGAYRIEMVHSSHIYDEGGESVLYFESENHKEQIMEEFQAGRDYFLSKYDYLRVVVRDRNDSVIAWYGGSVKYEAY